MHRFSQSSIDLASRTSSDSTNPLLAKNRRILYKSSHNDIPSIHLSQEDSDRPASPTSVATSNTASWSKLETLEEVPEPNSKNSSFESERLSKIFWTHLANELELDIDAVRRKLSDACSRVDTLTGETNEEESNNNNNNTDK